MDEDFDIERARAETRGCEKLIHFNNAGASLPPIPVADALYGYLQQEETQGGYEVMARREAELEHFYSAAARLLNCTTAEIAFTDSATRSWSSAFYAFEFASGDRILAGSAEYGSNLVGLLHLAKKQGVEIIWVPDDNQGQIDIAALDSLIDEQVKLICLTQAPSGNGLVNPAAAVGKLAKKNGIPFLLDACQTLGQQPVDVEEIGCDILCGTGRKFLRAPRGTGLLYVRQSLIDQLQPSQLNHHAADLLNDSSYRLRPDARRFEVWERNYAGQLALGVAIDYALDWGLEHIGKRVMDLAGDLRAQLASIEGMTVTDQGVEQSGIVTFFSAQACHDTLQRQLAEHHINISKVPFSANPVSSQQRNLPPLLRASVHYYNTHKEIEHVIKTLKVLVRS